MKHKINSIHVYVGNLISSENRVFSQTCQVNVSRDGLPTKVYSKKQITPYLTDTIHTITSRNTHQVSVIPRQGVTSVFIYNH